MDYRDDSYIRQSVHKVPLYTHTHTPKKTKLRVFDPTVFQSW